MKILYKGSLILILLISIILSCIIWYLNNTITILEDENNVLKDSLSICVTENEKYFKFERIGVASLIITKGDIQLGNDFVASILIGAHNYTTKKPIVIIGDSINENNEIFCNLDTFCTNNIETIIKRKYLKKGKKKIYGKLIHITLEGEDFDMYFDIDNINIE